MSARDGGKLSEATSAERMAAEALDAAHAAEHTRDLVLGPLLLIGGAIFGVLAFWLITNGIAYYSWLFVVVALGSLSSGLHRLRRGLMF